VFDQDVMQRMSAFFSPTRVDSFLQLLKRRKDSNLEKVIAAVGKTSDYDINGKFLHCCL
jgi:uroporphyrinogen-III synthase